MKSNIWQRVQRMIVAAFLVAMLLEFFKLKYYHGQDLADQYIGSLALLDAFLLLVIYLYVVISEA